MTTPFPVTITTYEELRLLEEEERQAALHKRRLINEEPEQRNFFDTPQAEAGAL